MFISVLLFFTINFVANISATDIDISNGTINFISMNAATINFCQLCESGNCTKSYRGHEGQWCGHWMHQHDRLPCCCPKDATCASRTATECRCISHSDSIIDMIMYLLLISFVVMTLIAVCFTFFKNYNNGYYRRNNDYNPVYDTNNNQTYFFFTDYNTHTNSNDGFAGDC
jgi:hypothetical protein